MNDLIVKPELLESTIAYSWNDSCYSVVLKNATQAQLHILQDQGFDLFVIDQLSGKKLKEK
jgi:hypothetical protein